VNVYELSNLGILGLRNSSIDNLQSLNSRQAFSMLLGTLIYGFINSSILALVALGFNLTFGISGVANFAYGAVYIFSGFMTWIFLNSLGLPYLLCVIISILFSAVLGLLTYYLIILRIKGLAISEVMATFGLGLAIMELFRYFNFVGFRYTIPVFYDGSIAIGGVYVDLQRIFIALIAVGLTLFLYLFTHHTKTGLAFRSIAQDERTALTFGIDSDRIGALSMAFGAGLAAVAAIVILPLGTIAVEGGYEVLINALAVCIVGGLGSTIGILVASVLIGFAQTFTANYLEPHWMILVSLIAIAIVLVIKPSGLFSHQKELEERI
jgi:branched-chain amino acid transport system permease protein